MTDPAPLFSAPGAPAPLGGRAEWIEGVGNIRLRLATFPVADPRGTALLSGGRTEFIEKYYEVIGELNARGYTVVTHDWRGQGLSQRLLANPLKGHAAGFDDFVADYGRILDRFAPQAARPLVALSHSMGGGLTALALADGERRVDAVVLSSPMIGLPAAFRPLHGLLVGAMGAVAPTLSFPLGQVGDLSADSFESNEVTHDRSRFERNRAFVVAHRELTLGVATWGWVKSAFDSSLRLTDRGRAGKIGVPLTIVAAGDERLVSNPASQAFAEAVPHGRFTLAPGARHEILMERDEFRAAFWREFDAFTAGLSPPA